MKKIISLLKFVLLIGFAQAQYNPIYDSIQFNAGCLFTDQLRYAQLSGTDYSYMRVNLNQFQYKGRTGTVVYNFVIMPDGEISIERTDTVTDESQTVSFGDTKLTSEWTRNDTVWTYGLQSALGGTVRGGFFIQAPNSDLIMSDVLNPLIGHTIKMENNLNRMQIFPDSGRHLIETDTLLITDLGGDTTLMILNDVVSIGGIVPKMQIFENGSYFYGNKLSDNGSGTLFIESGLTGIADAVPVSEIRINDGTTMFRVSAGNGTVSPASRFEVDANGNLRAFTLHNNATTQGNASNQDIRSGTYTPSLTNVTNIAASTAYACQWLRVGNVVTVSGKVDIDVTLGIASELGMSLPVTSNMTAEQNAGGTASSAAAASLVSAIRADATNDRAAFVFTAVSVNNDSYFFEFSYLIQ